MTDHDFEHIEAYSRIISELVAAVVFFGVFMMLAAFWLHGW